MLFLLTTEAKPGKKQNNWSKKVQYGKEINSLLDCVSKLMFSVFNRCSTSHNLMNLVTSIGEFVKVIWKR